MAADPARTQLRVGRLVKAHGLKGALKLELYTDDPDGRFVPGATFTLQVPEASPWHGKSVTVREFRWMNSHPVLFLEDVNDRDAAESLVKAILWVDQDGDATVEDDAWFDHQLVGLDVVRDGERVGRIARVDHLPAQDLLIVQRDGDDTEILVPFVKAIVPEVDVAAGRVIVTPPAGLFEDLPAEEADDASGAASDRDGDDAPSED
ncbi:ribosome maturation factor RimM [Microbacterium sp. AISO3]|jgi:16S rRNA processing protein RimM|uniref:Ribosome maturation factor RimM n=1 Tax=Microbacterium arborescens TaxID=33883 RepID=A0ABX2WGI5_9MICO|nr:MULTISPECIES: ribosome maturation factor RimM [Microbacterium]APF33402.1 ribosome maturation factor RimM [Microbacterium paludicola]OAZ39725.1 ribosome maturation factor RimM [Microbacterium arborescens]OWP22800.1 ribosome maturation factor RimM [Microbacterium sp. AISO3]POX67075.1 ribosome maturation factor RimM [Microbacterium sp. Ru50]QCR40286.1 ribosome maturation factor RimM [Microbacterium sp. SGAir0570]